MAESVLVERRGATMVITINRPQVRNALNHEAAVGIATALDELDAEEGLRVGVLTGAEGTFSSGMDLKAFGDGDVPLIDGRGLAGFTEAPPKKPLIAAVEGYALAGGFEIALACDLIVASREATFGLPEVRRGLIASAGGLTRLPRRVPLNVAMELAILGENLAAERAAQLGLVNVLTPAGEALETALELAARIAANGPLAVSVSKQVLGLAGEVGEAQARELQAPLRKTIEASEDAAEGSRAFVEKRAPVWRNR